MRCLRRVDRLFSLVGSTNQFPLDLKRGVMMHDMALTDKHMVFLDLPVVLKGELMLKGQLPIVFDKTAEARYETHSVFAGDHMLFCVNVFVRSPHRNPFRGQILPASIGSGITTIALSRLK